MSEVGSVQRGPACSSSSRSDVLTVRENTFGITKEFDYCVCPGCGSLALISIPEDMSPFYPTDYHSVDLDPERA